jgi:hypothetical protein
MYRRTNQGEATARKRKTTTTQTQKKSSKKIIDKDQGEYVDFEEID